MLAPLLRSTPVHKASSQPLFSVHVILGDTEKPFVFVRGLLVHVGLHAQERTTWVVRTREFTRDMKVTDGQTAGF